MRCPKCGTISFDWMKQCEKCGKELRDLARSLGLDAEGGEGINWFALDSSSAQEGSSAAAGAGPDLSSIDVSDLMAPDAQEPAGVDDDGPPEIDAEEVARIASDENLSRTLDQVIQQEA